jgi:hypothetical protein
MPERPIRVILPAKVAYNIDHLTKAIANLAERLGCRPCLSGRDCTFVLERDYVVNPESFKVQSLAGGGVIIDG